MLRQGTDLWNGQTDPGIRVEPARKNIISAPWPQRAAWLSQRGPELRTGGSAGGSQVLGHSSDSLFLLEPFICVQCQGWGLTHLPGGWETAPQVSKGRSRVQPPAYPPPPHHQTGTTFISMRRLEARCPRAIFTVSITNCTLPSCDS